MKSKILASLFLVFFIPALAGAASKKKGNSDGYEFHSGVTVLPAGTDGSAGTDATYVYFGDWPQTIKAPSVTVNEKKTLKMGGNVYYQGDDGAWYARVVENGKSGRLCYSDDSAVSTVKAGRTKYFKVEPIKWRVLTLNYNGSGKALLFAENVLDAVPFYPAAAVEDGGAVNVPARKIDSNPSVYENNYKYSQVRAFLNGTEYYCGDGKSPAAAKKSEYKGKGFLQGAFGSSAQKLIAVSDVDTAARNASFAPGGGKFAEGENDYASGLCRDRVFLLSEDELNNPEFSFVPYSAAAGADWGALNVRNPSDYAVAKGCDMADFDGIRYILRTPGRDEKTASDGRMSVVGIDGGRACSILVNSTDAGLVPALAVSLPLDSDVKVDAGWISMGDLKNKFERTRPSVTRAIASKKDGMYGVKGGAVNNSVRYSQLFTYARGASVSDLFASDHTVSASEYAKYCAGDGNSKTFSGSDWYEAVIYCNQRSIAEGLVPAYYVADGSERLYDPADWALKENGIKSDARGKYYYEGSASTYLDSRLRMDASADGYRLPTEIEWEYLALFYGIYGSESEWCWDWWVSFDGMPQDMPLTGVEKGSERVLRGFYGSGTDEQMSLTERRSRAPAENALFRVVRTDTGSAAGVYSVAVQSEPPESGRAAGSLNAARAGALVRLECSENVGYELDSYEVKDADGKGVKVSASGSFIMPSSNVSVTAKFRKARAYPVTLNKSENVTVKSDRSEACTGEQVTLSFEFAQGYDIDSISVKDSSGNAVPVSGGKSFIMPKGGASVSVTVQQYDSKNFVYVPGATVKSIPGSNVFTGKAVEIKDMYACKHETTQAEWEKYMTYYGTASIGSSAGQSNDPNPYCPIARNGKGPEYPAYALNWFEAIIYCNLRSMDEGLEPVYYMGSMEKDPAQWEKISGSFVRHDSRGKYYVNDTTDSSSLAKVKMDADANGYRLPTEAEWEYLARGGSTKVSSRGTKYAGSDNFNNVGWCGRVASSGKAHEVMQKSANYLGLYDMSGNVAEWCWEKTHRGGSWNSVVSSSTKEAEECTVYGRPPESKTKIGERRVIAMAGLRVVRTKF